MIKAVAKAGDGSQVLILGLSKTNIERLLEDQPIQLSREQMTELGMPDMTIVLMGGEMEQEIAAQLGRSIPQPQPSEQEKP